MLLERGGVALAQQELCRNKGKLGHSLRKRFGQKAFQTKLFAGGYSLKQAFWGFGVVGGSVLLAIAGAYVGHVLQSDQSSGAGWTLSAIRGVSVPIALYALVTFVGIWRSAKQSVWWVKIVARYFSIFSSALLVPA